MEVVTWEVGLEDVKHKYKTKYENRQNNKQIRRKANINVESGKYYEGKVWARNFMNCDGKDGGIGSKWFVKSSLEVQVEVGY